MPVWKNYLNDQNSTITKKHWLTPRTPKQARQFVEEIIKKDPNVPIKVIGSGHSASAVARPDKYLIDISEMKRVSSPNTKWLNARGKSEVEKGKLLQIEAGISIKKLNAKLAILGKALSNMGGYDAQTIIGALCTGTHGSGLRHGPIADAVRSLEIVVVEKGKPIKSKRKKRNTHQPIVKHYRIEPNRGITNPSAFKADKSRHKMELIQDDGVFYSVVVSMGTMGVVTRLILKVENEKFYLEESYDYVNWGYLQEKVRGEARILREARKYEYYQVYVNPIIPGGYIKEAMCLITRRKRVIPSRNKLNTWNKSSPPERDVSLGEAIMLEITGKFTRGIARATNLAPKVISDMINENFKKKADKSKKKPFVSRSDKVLITGFAVPADTTEIAIPLDKTVQGVNIILKAAKEWEKKDIYHTSPFGIRFVAPSKHYLAMQYNRPTTMIEVPLLKGTAGRPDAKLFKKLFLGLGLFLPIGIGSKKRIEDIFRRIETRMYKIGGRPHWGQRHFITRQKIVRDKVYPLYARWEAAYKRFNAFGTFENRFTEAVRFKK